MFIMYIITSEVQTLKIVWIHIGSNDVDKLQ